MSRLEEKRCILARELGFPNGDPRERNWPHMVMRLPDWHGREVDAVRSRGGVWAFPDFSDNVIRSVPGHWPPPELVQKLCQSKQLSAFLPEDQSLLTHKLNQHSLALQTSIGRCWRWPWTLTGRNRAERRSPGWIEPIAEFMRVPEELAGGVSSWIWSNPSRCPGLRLLREMGMVISQNASYASRKDDLFDLPQILAIPYVDAITLDRTMADYFSRLKRARRNHSPQFGLPCKVFRNTSDLLHWVN